MASRELATLHRDLGLIAGPGTVAGLDDVELLRRFTDRQDAASQAAFEAIVVRHGPMVRGICRSLLRESADVDDAFQATFLVLLRKAHSVRIKDSLRPWLYGVSWRVARKAQAQARKRRSRESSGELDEAPQAERPDAGDLLPVLLGELERLPERYQTPIRLCHLDGLSHEEVARRLGCPTGTISSRLSRAREMLRSRLSRRGFGLPAVAVTSAFAAREASALPAALVRSTVQTVQATAGGSVSSGALQLTQGVIVSMIVNKMKLAGMAVLAGALAVGAAVERFPSVRAQPAGSRAEDLTPSEEKVPATIGLLEAVPAPIEDNRPARQSSVEAPALADITIDGDLKDWPPAMPRHSIKQLHVFPPLNGAGGLERADLATSPDLSAAFSVGYSPNEQLIYLAVIIRDDELVVGHLSPWDTDSVEVYLDGLRTDQFMPLPKQADWLENLNASDTPALQYVGLAGAGRVYGVKKSAGQAREADNPILMLGDIHKTKTRMAYRREGDVTIYEWALQAFDHYPDRPTALIPYKRIGFDLSLNDKDNPAASDDPYAEPEAERPAWICWGPRHQGLIKHLNAGNLGEIVLGRIP